MTAPDFAPIVHVFDWQGEEADDIAFHKTANDAGWRYTTSGHYPTTAKSLPVRDDDILWTRAELGVWQCVFKMAGSVVRAAISGGSIGFTIRGPKPDFNTILDWIGAHAPRVEVAATGWRPVNFWFSGAKGPRKMMRRINIVSWSDIKRNYTSDIRELMDGLTDPAWRPTPEGKLILWRGVPGTGKTYAIRALMNAWGEWADFNYIVDPDAFFGANPEYLMNVVTEAEEDEEQVTKIQIDEASMEVTQRWMVVVLEDAGELMTADAKERAGQALSRLLNVVDGFIGQGLRVLLLITTNEEIGKLHPAVSRPGRCLMNQEFTLLTHAEIAEWARQHDVDPAPQSGRLADLYAALRGRAVKSTLPVGFTGPF